MNEPRAGAEHDSGPAIIDENGDCAVRNLDGYTWDGSYTFGDTAPWSDGALWSDGTNTTMSINSRAEQE